MQIEFAGFCIQGLVRQNNEDNWWLFDHLLPEIHQDEEMMTVQRSSSTRKCRFAVFDGMGGMKFGEKASFAAASAYHNTGKMFTKSTAKVCRAMNEAVLKEANQLRASGMGSTVVGLEISGTKVNIFNVGDSRCYRFSGGILDQLSTDHAIVSPYLRKSRLTQCLGIDECEFRIEPSEVHTTAESGDLYLLCSDGLTAFVKDDEIRDVLISETDTGKLAEKLERLVYEKGAVDNTTVILVRIV